MAQWQCTICLGTYRDPDATGRAYYHTCPGFSALELLALPAADLHALIPDLPTTFTRADLDWRLARAPVPRSYGRNENYVPGQVAPLVTVGDPPTGWVPAQIQPAPPRVYVGP